MPKTFSIWLDEKTADILDKLAAQEDRKRGAMVKVLIRRAAEKIIQQTDSMSKDKNDS